MINIHVWEVDEYLEDFVSDPPVPSDFIYHISQTGEWMVVTPRKYWIAERCQYDQPIEDVLKGIAPGCVDLFDGMDVNETGTFLIDGKNVTTIAYRLSGAGFGTDPAFDTFMN